jgi:hypothetical protein
MGMVKGSGRWVRYSRKSTTDEELCLDIASLNRHGGLDPGAGGTIQWTQAKNVLSAQFHTTDSELHIACDWGGPGSSRARTCHILELQTTPCHYGGVAKWFSCFSCGRRCSALYLIGRVFLCRICGQLSYRSQQQNVISRTISNIEKIHDKLGISGARALDPFPPRPKGVHRYKYAKLKEKAEALQQRLATAIIERFGIPP